MISDKQHIDQLMVEKLSGYISGEDDQELHQLLEDDKELKQVYTGLQQQLNHPEAKQYLDELDEDILWQKKQHLFYRRSNKHLLYRVAAGLLIVIGSGFLYTFFPREHKQMPIVAKQSPGITLQLANGQKINLSDSSQAPVLSVGTVQMHLSPKSLQYEATGTSQAAAMNILRVPAGKDYKLTLTDGTEVWLNSMSEISFPLAFNGSTREVSVRGEAYFSVKKDIDHPFIVHTGEVSINVLGTAFNVNTYSNTNTKIALSSGKVSLKSNTGNQQIQLRPGYEATCDNDFSVDEFNPKNTLAWMEGKYYFKKSTLKDIAIVITRLFDIPVVFDDATVENVTVTGVLTKKDGLAEFMDNLSQTTSIRYQLSDHALHIH
ncbi:FecR family protein [Chitinophaga sp. YR573]|uniref:FecR family protein n=1 Tax=Chitinophaga sp. YR573 TaxID=1881040 RepID=UPI000B7D6192|nr:FecR domain-containing protein [Chitinophaga sp. YR573]